MEQWKTIENYDMYEVSSYGNFRSKFVKKFGEEYREIKGSVNGSGYQTIFLINKDGQKSARAHRLVAEAFLDNPLGKATVNHIDGHKMNNRLDNLEWATYAENNKHAHDTGLVSNRKGYSEPDRLEMIKLYIDGERPSDISRKYCVNTQTLYRILHKAGIKFDSRKSAYKHSFDDRKRIKSIIMTSDKTNVELSEELNLSKEHIGKIKNNTRWKDIVI